MKTVSIREAVSKLGTTDRLLQNAIQEGFLSLVAVEDRQEIAWEGAEAAFRRFTLTVQARLESGEKPFSKPIESQDATGKRVNAVLTAKTKEFKLKEMERLSDATQRKEIAQADKAECEAAKSRIELLKMAQKLADAEEAEENFAIIVADARDELMNIPTRVKSEFQDVDQRIINFLESEVSEILMRLSKVPERENISID